MIGAVLLIAAWTLWTFFPEQGVETFEATLVRGALAAAAGLVLVLVLSVPLRALGVMRWSPPYDGYARLRDYRRRRIEHAALERQQRKDAPYRAIQSLGD